MNRKYSNVLSLNNKYKFNLIYKKCHDGFDCMTFHNKCNGQGPFIVLIKFQSKKIYCIMVVNNAGKIIPFDFIIIY